MKLDCGHEPSTHSQYDTGYGTDANGKTACYECCAEHEKQAMRDIGKATLYLTGNDSKGYEVTDWPGLLRLNPYRVTHGRHNIAGTRTDAWFNFEGKPWHCVQYGEWTQIAHCKRTKR